MVVDCDALVSTPASETAYVHRVKEIVHDGTIAFPAKDGTLWKWDTIEGEQRRTEAETVLVEN